MENQQYLSDDQRIHFRENQKLTAQQLTQHAPPNLQTLIDIAAEAKRAQRSEQQYLTLCADLDNTVHSLKHEREELLKRNEALNKELQKAILQRAKRRA